MDVRVLSIILHLKPNNLLFRPLSERKVSIIQELTQREEFLEGQFNLHSSLQWSRVLMIFLAISEIEEFEKKASGDADRYKKSNSLALADENKFRAYAAKKLAELDSKAIKLCRAYNADTGRLLEIDGVNYLEMIVSSSYSNLVSKI